MASVGTILKREREKKKISIAEIALNTKIPEKYLRAIEKDDHGIFPGETYLVGFIRNYARELELDPNEIVSMYKNTRLEKGKSSSDLQYVSREVAPQENRSRIKKQTERISDAELNRTDLPPRHAQGAQNPQEKAGKNESSGFFGEIGKFFTFLFKNQISMLLSLGGIILIILLVLILVNMKNCKRSGSDKEKFGAIQVLQMEQMAGVYDLNLNEYYKLRLGKDFFTIMGEIMNNTGNPDAGTTGTKLLLHINDAIFELPQGLKKEVDLNVDGQMDISLKLNSIMENSYNITIEKLHEFSTNTTLQTNFAQTNARQNSATFKKDTKDEAFTSFGAKKKIVFIAEVVEKSYFKAWVDGVEQEGKLYYPSQKIELIAQDTIQFRLGNPPGLKVTINGKPVKLGGRGTANKTIKWKRDLLDENLYNLVITDWQ